MELRRVFGQPDLSQEDLAGGIAYTGCDQNSQVERAVPVVVVARITVRQEHDRWRRLSMREYDL